MTDDNERMFAYGCNEEDGHECPAMSVGMNPNDSKALREMAGQYDIEAHRDRDDNRGVVSETVARRRWLMALDVLRNDAERSSCDVYEKAVRRGRQIAEQHGWV